MAHTLHVTADEVQNWLSEDRLQITVTDDIEEELHAARYVLSKLAPAYPVEVVNWIDSTSTPELVRTAISAKTAAAIYRKHYADQDDELEYANWLEQLCMNIVDGIVDGSLVLLDQTTTIQDAAAVARSISFYPDDSTGSDDATTGLEESRRFTIGEKF